MSDFFDDLPAFRGRVGKEKIRSATQSYYNTKGKIGQRFGGKTSYKRSIPGAKGRNVRPVSVNSQRVLVKISTVKLTGNNANKAHAHMKYLLRDGAGENEQKAILFGESKRKIVDPEQFIAESQNDKHQFRIILSPENAHRLDMEDYVRDVMKQVQKDLKTKIYWVGVVHKNTDNPHAHIVLRGKCGKEAENDLYLKREYIAHGIRTRAQEIATQELGSRTEDEIKKAQQREVTQSRLTALDRMIFRSAGAENFINSTALPGRDVDEKHAIRQRLEHLHQLNFVTKEEDGWRIQPGAKEDLKALGLKEDIIHRMNQSGKARDGKWTEQLPEEPILAKIVHRGVADEHLDTRYVIAKGIDGKTYYLDKNQKFIADAAPGIIVRLSDEKQEITSRLSLKESVSYAGPTILDRPTTSELVQKFEENSDGFAKEIKAFQKKRAEFLEQNNITATYPELRKLEVGSWHVSSANRLNLPAHWLREGHVVKGHVLEIQRLESGTYALFKTENNSIAVVQADTPIREAFKDKAEITVQIYKEKGRLRHSVARTELSKETPEPSGKPIKDNKGQER